MQIVVEKKRTADGLALKQFAVHHVFGCDVESFAVGLGVGDVVVGVPRVVLGIALDIKCVAWFSHSEVVRALILAWREKSLD